MKMTEINKRFTEKVTEYIMNGYIINAGTMGGSQGEIAKVDLVKGTELVRIYLDRESSFGRDANGWCGRKIVLRVGRWVEEVRKGSTDSTVWMNKLTTIEEFFFYRVGESYNEWYVDSLEEALHCQQVKESRYNHTPYAPYLSNYKSYTHLTDDRHKEIAVRFLKRKWGYKRVSKDKMELTKIVPLNGRIYYKINYGSNTYTIICKN